MSFNLGPFEAMLLAELRVGLSPLFYLRLADIDDDWAFLLKVHSFFEGVITNLIHEKLRLRPNCSESASPRDSFISRMHLAERLGVLEPDYRAFLMGLNRLRNDITHNIRFIDFDLRRYVDSLSDTEFRRTAAALCAGLKNGPASNFPAAHLMPVAKSTRPRQVNTVRELFWQSVPRFSIWLAGYMTLDLLSLHFHFEKTSGVWQPTDSDLNAKLQDLLLDPAVLKLQQKKD
ncbi:MAG: hypothetical protein ABSH34_00615 [Verrucomicrobiota bacterium]|jgi:hypothetical protein